MEVITSLENKRIKEFAKLLQKKYRDGEGKFLVEGEHLVEEAFKSGYLLEVVKCEEFERDFDVPTTYVTYDVLKKLSNVMAPQKVIGVCKKKDDKLVGNKVLLLDDIQDPGNLGTIIRSSVAFGLDTIVLSNGTVDVYNDKVIRSSEGMLFYVNVVRDDIKSVIYNLKNDGFKVYGTNVNNGEDVRNISTFSKIALVMGNEGAGVKDEILDMCDNYIYITMNKNCESLNVGVATSIILYEFYKGSFVNGEDKF
ncbi:MAG: RNA methyltransferase [Bacilli bacterium]|nr:RNA methyltransferase [Bacilli bacterium]